MSDHSAAFGKMACRHEPRDPIAALVHVCKRCGVPIEARSCMACDGTGRNMDPLSEGMWCKECDRSGIDRWEVVT